ncbi:MAG: iron export ABC transporter permease subunit FetB [Syntrophomonadaceae bacterium]|nr:iron export ABC transporter permease subunit FetB [Syntrophomonadaceae bacterium]
MTYFSLLLALSFVLVAVIISFKEKLDLERDLLVGTVRAFVQLMVVGYVLEFIFALEKWPYIVAMLVFMVLVAARNAENRGQGIRNVFPILLLAIGAGELVTMGMLLGLGIIPFQPQYVIPISGMIIGNSMVASALTLNRIKAELENRREEIQVLLGLGATARQASGTSLQAAVKSAMIPTIDSMKTVGLVQLPGMMTGLIIGGASPVEAVKYQILVLFMLTTAVSLTAMTVGFFAYRKFFTERHQLVL